MSSRLQAALDRIDAANSKDPNSHNGAPRAQLQGESASKWLKRLKTEPSDELQLAARAHHLKRWELKRADFAEGRAGYLNWRRTNKNHQAAEAVKILVESGFGEASCQRVTELLLRRQLGSDAETQTLEDVACLTFIETEFEQIAGRLTEEKMLAVVSKTLKKMSVDAIRLATEIPVNNQCSELLNRASSQVDG